MQKNCAYNPNLDVINVNEYTNFGQFLSIHSQDISSGNEIMTLIKGCNSVTNLGNLMFYNSNRDIIYGNVYTKVG